MPRYLWVFDHGQRVAGSLLKGLWVTVQTTAAGMVLAFTIGIVTTLFRLSDSFVALAVARAYLEGIRNTPLFVQIFFIYFVIAPVIDMNAFTSAILALSLFEGAYMSEIFRSGIVSIKQGQW